jgi:malic enzyme
MPILQASPAVAIAHAHVEAWSNHDFDAARSGLAADVTVTATSTNPDLPDTKLTGIDNYMRGLIEFAQLVVAGSARVLATLGDERNAFPGFFRGLLDASVRAVRPEMKVEAARAIADVITEDGVTEDYVVPSVFDRRVVPAVAAAVRAAAG